MTATRVERAWMDGAGVILGGGDECWEWGGYISTQGYGRISVGGKKHYAHRVAYGMVNGPIPDGMFVCHRCDNRRCCRHDHLFLGTTRDNARDAAQKDRIAFGERSGTHRFTADVVASMRLAVAEGQLQRDVAARFGISEGHLSAIVNGKARRREMIGFRDVEDVQWREAL